MSTKHVCLPNGLLVAGEVVRDVEIVKLTGEHEDMIRDKKLLREGNILDKLLKSCIAAIGPVSDKERISAIYDSDMLLADQQFLLVQVRIWGVGKTYMFDATCPYCETIGRHSIDLTSLAVDEQKEEYRGQKELIAVVEPEDEPKVAIKYKQLYAKDMRTVEMIKHDYPRDKATRELMIQLQEVDGTRPLPPTVKKMSMKLRNAIRAEMDKSVGGIDMELEMECKKCDRTFKDNLPVDIRDFFYPAADMRRTPTPAKPFRSSGGTLGSSDVNGAGVLSA